MQSRSYPAVRVRQTKEAGDLVLFAAPATDIDDWSGVPQREDLGGGAEAVGFQRTENPKRLKEIASFFGNPKNIIQNPLLLASRDAQRVKFSPSDSSDQSPDGSQLGMLTIEWEDLSGVSLLELLRRVKTTLEVRVPELKSKSLDPTEITRLKGRANSEHPDIKSLLDSEGDVEEDEPAVAEDEDDGGADLATSLLLNDMHIADFWQDVAARVKILEDTGEFDGDTFLGFDKEAMISYLQPLVVVDGQHRLRGALLVAKAAPDSSEMRREAQSALGRNPDEVFEEMVRREARCLPVSLLIDPSPAEHVFQFVLVNQKATPIGTALLGTIVSTSLSEDELLGVSERLTAAGIPLHDSQAIAYLTRNADSPFFGLVQRGVSREGTDLLQWNVLGSLMKIFRDLKNGKLYHENLDHADRWRRTLLESSEIVVVQDLGDDKFEVWRRPDGPWRDVFIAFWIAVRDTLATTDEADADAGNYWGSNNNSNLFNKITLTILAADFFQFLNERQRPIDSISEIAELVDDWLDGVKQTYFSRDWKLQSVKKDQAGIKKQWASQWALYRKDPVRVPPVEVFRQLKA